MFLSTSIWIQVGGVAQSEQRLPTTGRAGDRIPVRVSDTAGKVLQ